MCHRPCNNAVWMYTDGTTWWNLRIPGCWQCSNVSCFPGCGNCDLRSTAWIAEEESCIK